jgi:RNA polymerase sigma factor (sigma-70 family)
MPSPPTDFRALIQAVLAGDPAAAEQFCRDYQSHILRVVRQRLTRRLRSKFDSLDIVHDVWASFFAAPPRHLHFDGPAAVIAYLEQMARNKVGELVRQQVRAQKYDVNREQPLPEPLPGSCSIPLAAAQPTPSQVVCAEEQWERMLRGEPLRKQRILMLLRYGLSHREIATRLKTNEKTVQRLIRRLDPRPQR